MFLKYWSGATDTEYNNPNGDHAAPTTVPLELQQVDCSNPNGYAPSGTNNCLHDNGGKGQTGNLNDIYTFAAGKHASMFELYKHDALLAFDPFYCVYSTGDTTCNASSSDSLADDLSFDAQFDFFNAAGLGSGCASTYNVAYSGPGTGACAYAAALATIHGAH
jgi:hypothetical protein